MNKLKEIKIIENRLFYIGLITGTIILITPFFSSASFALSIPASFFGYSVCLYKLLK